MAKFEHHIFVCTNQRPPENPRGCCDPEGLGNLQILFKKALAECGLKATVRANRSGCLDQCEHGPTVVIYPEGVWYGGVKPEDVTEIIESHIINKTPVTRLMLADGCINTPVCQHKQPRKSE
ncbi:MAG: (2Fe-2S) ferredoxin domain-containing protein [Acidobacteria bacterium]|nr:(2Fe-2S) ferredoxin domain-containing protein [Acidobacteriota bacterium]